MTGVVVATVRGVADQADQIGNVTDQAIDKAAEQLDAAGVDQAALEDARSGHRGRGPDDRHGFLTKVVSGVGSASSGWSAASSSAR